MLVFAISDIRFIAILLGTSNFIPVMWGISPFQIIMVTLMLSTIYTVKWKIKDSIIEVCKKREIIICAILLVWLAICSVVHKFDLSLIQPVLTALITIIFIYILITNNIISVKRFFGYYTLGLGHSLILGYMSINKMLGYKVYGYLNRLAFVRGDANSLGLIYTCLVIMIAAYLLYRFRTQTLLKKELILLIPFLISLNYTLKTASRGSLVGIAGGLFIMLFIFRGTKIKRKINFTKKKVIILSTVIAIMAVILLVFGGTIKNIIFHKYSVIFERLFDFGGSIKEDVRFILYTNALKFGFQNPIFGYGIANFREKMEFMNHSVFFDFLTAGGFIALGLFLTLFGTVIKRLGSFIKKNNNPIAYSILMGTVSVLICGTFYSATGDKTLWIPIALAMCFYSSSEKIEV
ncbi:Hypothetical O-antigen polymerase [Clostridium chauvoei JF4335]|nr:Hypothetical O-antigen polymerase [Clostridium chauvoei JF4335]